MNRATRDWVDPRTYEETKHHAGCDWAWEFLRRNHGYVSDWHFVAGSDEGGHPDFKTMAARFAALDAGSKWALFFGDAPEKGAAEAEIFWDNNLCFNVITLFAFPAGSLAGAAAVDVKKVSGLQKVLVTADGHCHLLFKIGSRSVQICLLGRSSARSVHLLADAIVGLDLLSSGLKGIQDLNQLLTGNVISSRYFSEVNDHRLRRILRAVDGRQAGASYREIAVVLFGANRVKRDWSNGDHLKNHVRRLVKRGEALVGGGYRRFLQMR